MTAWLIDGSALVRLAESTQAEEWAGRIERGPGGYLDGHPPRDRFPGPVGRGSPLGSRRSPLALMPIEYLTPSIPDLLIAATAELAQLKVLHVDNDFELIADVTRQSVERLAGIGQRRLHDHIAAHLGTRCDLRSATSRVQS